MASGGLGALMYGTVKDRVEHLFPTSNSGSGRDGVHSVMTCHL